MFFLQMMHAHSLKLGHFTMDNASNNTTMIESLAKKLALHDIHFDVHDHRVMCFAHVIDLCSGQVIYATSGGVEHVDVSSSSSSDAATSDPIAIARAAVRAIWGSSLHQEAFNKVIKEGNTLGWFK
jgi:hypothetical protein